MTKDMCQLENDDDLSKFEGFTWDVAGNGVEELVRPGDRQELLPPSGGNEGDVESKDEGEGNETEKCIEVFHYAFKQPENGLIKKRAQKWRSPFLLLVHELSVEGTEKDVDNEVEAEFSTDELVEGALH